MTPPQAPDLRVGIVGYGVMGRAHCYGYRVAPMLRALPVTPVVSVMSGRSGPAVAAAAAAYGVPEHTTDWHALVARDDIDVVDICTPPGTHAEIAQAAAAAGKAVLCEKPLAVSYPQAAAALAAVEAAGVRHAVGFNYRRLPAVALMRRMVAGGAVGEVRLWRASWLSDEFTDPQTPYDWRFDRSMGGTTIADLGSHLIDLALWMAGEIGSVCAQSQTFTRARPLPGGPGGGAQPVTVDDASSALLRFSSGALGTMEVARAAVRRPCDFTVEVNGSRGTLVFDYARLNELRYGSAGDDPGLYGMRRIRAEHPSHPYAASWWPLGQGVGYGSSFGNQAADLLAGWPDAPWDPGFGQGAAVQAVCDAMEASAASGRWVAVSEVTAAQPPG
ncbi:MAG TPA: Gfo/Idh/MocA family oxidoreductase [Streptosporangiaceae bacterium]|nr:Gfo/Idh/MocA family oxidoreductase [Streptosporangiaceae bacterium]